MSNIHFIFLLYIFIIALYLGFTPNSAELPLLSHGVARKKESKGNKAYWKAD